MYHLQRVKKEKNFEKQSVLFFLFTDLDEGFLFLFKMNIIGRIRNRTQRKSQDPLKEPVRENKENKEVKEKEKAKGPPREEKDKTKSEKETQPQSSRPGPDDPTSKDRLIKRKQIVKFVKNTVEKGPAGIRNEFSTMKRFNDFEKMKAFKNAQDKNKNRYKDVGCLDNNRVKLGSPWPHDYIHGNFVATPSNPKRFICTQAPMEKTCADFWFMCLQEKVESIFMLCNLVEKGAKKCFEYYPSKEKTMEFEEKGLKITVKFESSAVLKWEKPSESKVMETVLNVEGPGGLTLRTTHYHWIDWPDRGVPVADLALCELLAKSRVSKNPIVVHCSAGIGRTGSVVMIEYMIDTLLIGGIIEDSDKILLRIREQRNNSIQTDLQYLFVHQVMMNFLLDKKLFDNDVKMAHLDFTTKYLKAVS
uniref:Protein-tyrosine phosphatase n=1 Tax=Caenorhabditis tropicalis TaxID=1561998 RepID=A0A1I7TU72_9PELO